MTKQPDNLVLEHLRALRESHAETNLKIEAMAGSLVSMNRKLGDVDRKVGNLERKIGDLENSVEGLGADVRVVAIAVDGHAHRLDRMEDRLAHMAN